MTESKRVACLFCGRSAPEIKLSNEHVIRAKFRSALERPDTRGWQRTLQSAEQIKQGAAGETKLIPASPWEQKIREVCTDCNLLVLNDQIEVPAEHLLLPMMRGESLDLSAVDLRRVAVWAVKTAIVRGACDPPPRVVSPQDARHLRDTLEPAPGNWVAIGRAVPQEKWIWSKHSRFEATTEGGSTGMGHLSTFVLGHLLVLVRGIDSQADPEIVDNLPDFKDQTDLDDFLVQSWPEPRGRSWPPPVTWTPEAVVALSDTYSVNRDPFGLA